MALFRTLFLILLVTGIGPRGFAQEDPPDRETLLQKAAPICERAMTLEGSPAAASGPALTLMRIKGMPDWTYSGDLQLPGGMVPAAQVRALVCIEEVTHREGRKYDDGAEAYTRRWDVRVVSWPEGEFLRQRRLVSSAPFVKRGSGPGVGERPLGKLARLLDHPAIVSHIQEADAETAEMFTRMSAALSADQKRFAAVAKDKNSVSIRDVSTGQLVRRIPVQSRGYTGVDRVALSPDGSRVATSVPRKQKRPNFGPFDSVTTWNVATGKETRPMQSAHPRAILALAYSPDGSHLVSSSEDGAVNVWDAEKGRLQRALPGHEGHVWDVAFSPDGSLIATAGNDRSAQLWEGATAKLRMRLDPGGPVTSLAFSSDGRLLATGLGDQQSAVVVWDASSGQRIRDIPHPNSVTAVAWSPDGRYLATGTSREPDVRIWEIESGTEAARLTSHEGDIRILSFSADGTRLFSAGDDGALKTWDLERAIPPE